MEVIPTVKIRKVINSELLFSYQYNDRLWQRSLRENGLCHHMKQSIKFRAVNKSPDNYFILLGNS